MTKWLPIGGWLLIRVAAHSRFYCTFIYNFLISKEDRDSHQIFMNEFMLHQISLIISILLYIFVIIIHPPTVFMFIKAPPYQGRLLVFVRFQRAWTPPLIHATLISTKPLFQLIWCSTYWIQVLIPRLHQFFRKFVKIFGSRGPSLIFFHQIWTLSTR